MRDGRRKVEQVGRGLIINSLIFWSSSLLFLKLFFFIAYTVTHVPIWPPLCRPLPAPALAALPSGHHHCCLCPRVMHVCSLANPFTFFHPVSSPPSSQTAAGLLHVSMTLFLFYSSVYFVLQIPHISEIIWYLSFTDWLISLSICGDSW